jgi:alpha-glucosidase
MSQALHQAGLKVIVDIVPNHTSDRHTWFREALAAPPGSAPRHRYIFRDGHGPAGSLPPSDWKSHFGGPAWERVPDGQWYLHLFAPQQPDLNWENREVREDFITTLRFWADRGVDGFRVDVAHGLAKNLQEPLPTQAELASDTLPHGEHPLEDRDEVHEIYAEWRHVFDEYDPPLIGVAEAWVHSSRRARYASPHGLGQAFNFDLLEANWRASEFRSIIGTTLRDVDESGVSATWVLSNHDVVRHPTRYGLPQGSAGEHQDGAAWLLTDGRVPELDRGLGLRRARAGTMLILALPGSTYLYQGEELGLHEVGDLPADALQDPTYYRSGGEEKGRDGCRVPLPWTSDGPSFGFGSDGAHLPQPSWFAGCSVAAQEADPSSTLAMYRSAIALRRELQTEATLEWVDSEDQVLHFVRPNGWHCIANFGSRPVALPQGSVVLSSGPTYDDLLPPDTTAWIR